jgi:hypothetical protein
LNGLSRSFCACSDRSESGGAHGDTVARQIADPRAVAARWPDARVRTLAHRDHRRGTRGWRREVS